MCEETEELEGKPCNLHNTTCKLNSRKGPLLGMEPTTSCMRRNERKQLTTLIDCAKGRFLFYVVVVAHVLSKEKLATLHPLGSAKGERSGLSQRRPLIPAASARQLSRCGESDTALELPECLRVCSV